MAEFYRAYFECAEDEASDITVDLFIGQDRRIVDHVPTSGWWGRFKSDDFWPFVLKPGGLLDFGANERLKSRPRSERFAHLRISDSVIAVGQKYVFNYGERWETMTLVKVTGIEKLCAPIEPADLD